MRGIYRPAEKYTIGPGDLTSEICHVSTMSLQHFLPWNWQYCYIPCLANTRPQPLTLQCATFFLNDYSFRAIIETKSWDWKFSHYKHFNPNERDSAYMAKSRGSLATQTPLLRQIKQPFLLAIKPDRGGRKTTCWCVWYNTFPSSPPLPIPPFPFLIIHPSTPPKASLFEAPHL